VPTKARRTCALGSARRAWKSIKNPLGLTPDAEPEACFCQRPARASCPPSPGVSLHAKPATRPHSRPRPSGLWTTACGVLNWVPALNFCFVPGPPGAPMNDSTTTGRCGHAPVGRRRPRRSPETWVVGFQQFNGVSSEC
jgi:hypothetical protein